MSVEIWPFLFTRSEYLDYQVVLCPDLIQKKGRLSFFRSNLKAGSGGVGHEQDQVEDIVDNDFGHLVLAYRQSQLTISGNRAKDPQGRPIFCFQGVIATGTEKRVELRLDDLLLQFAETYSKALQAFWREQDTFTPLISSRTVLSGIGGERREEEFPPKSHTKPHAPNSDKSARWFAIAALALLLLSVVANGAMVYFHSKEVSQLKASVKKLNSQNLSLRTQIFHYSRKPGLP
jgi:hypothetical protein